MRRLLTSHCIHACHRRMKLGRAAEALPRAIRLCWLAKACNLLLLLLSHDRFLATFRCHNYDLDSPLDRETGLDIFKVDPEYEQHETEYQVGCVSKLSMCCIITIMLCLSTSQWLTRRRLRYMLSACCKQQHAPASSVLRSISTYKFWHLWTAVTLDLHCKVNEQ